MIYESQCVVNVLLDDETDMKKRKASESDTAEQIKRSDAMGKFVNTPKFDVSFSSKDIMPRDLTEVYIISFVLLYPHFLVFEWFVFNFIES